MIKFVRVCVLMFISLHPLFLWITISRIVHCKLNSCCVFMSMYMYYSTGTVCATRHKLLHNIYLKVKHSCIVTPVTERQSRIPLVCEIHHALWDTICLYGSHSSSLCMSFYVGVCGLVQNVVIS